MPAESAQNPLDPALQAHMQTGDITEFDDKLVRKLIEKAIVYDDRLVVEFKSGLEIEVNL